MNDITEIKLKALIAEDDPFTNRLIVGFLRRMGFDVVACDDGAQALEKFKEQKFDIVILDGSMPEMTGFELTSIIRFDIGDKTTPILLQTALNDEDSIKLAFSVEANNVLLKPINYPLFKVNVLQLIKLSSSDNRVNKYTKILNSIFESSPDGLAVFDKDSGQVMIMNPTAEVYFKDPYLFSLFQDPDKFEIFSNKNQFNYEKEISIDIPGGPKLFLDLIIKRLLVPDGNIFLLRFADISNRKTEENRLINEHITFSGLLEEKDKLISIIAHDLRSPFQSYVGILEILFKEFSELSPGEIKNYLAHLYHSSKSLNLLIHNLFDWTSLRSGNMKNSIKKFSCKEFLDDIFEIMKISTNNKNISFSFDIKNESLCYSDKLRLSTIIRNLISNSIKFTKPGGSVKLHAEINKDEMTFRIEDTGIGLSRVQIKQLLNGEILKTVRGTNDEKGSGLGYVLIREFVSELKGKLEISSAKNKGTTVNIIIPQKRIQ